MRRYLAVLLTGLMVLSMAVTGCSKGDYKAQNEAYYEPTAASAAYDSSASYKSEGKQSMADYYYDEVAYDYPQEEYEYSENDTSSSEIPQAQYSEKLVYTCSINMQTTEFEKTLADLKALIEKYDGFIESENTTDNAYNWYYEDYRKTAGTLKEYIVVRIPTKSYNDFLTDIEGEGKITSKNQNVDNITREYYSVATTIESLETQEARLLQMMKDAETIEEMLQIEDRLTDVQNELAHYKMDLSSMDTDVDFSTVKMSIEEVLEYTPDETPVYTSTFGNRLKNTLSRTWRSFVDFCEDALFFIIESFPFFLIFGLVNLVIFIIVMKSVKKNKAKKAAKAEIAETAGNAIEEKEE